MSFLTPDVDLNRVNTDFLEPKYKDQFSLWQRNPTPHNASSLLKAVQPEIDRGISAHVGQANPLLTSRARRMTLHAIRSYDPTKAKLSTHIINQLQGLKRVARQQGQVLPIPERVSIDLNHVNRARAELSDELGRDPSMAELSDATGLSAKRLGYVQKFRYPVAEGTLTALGDEGDDASGFSPAVQAGYSSSWAEFVYSDLDPINQKIMEWTLGLHNEQPQSNMAIARKLGLTPGAVSQRKARIQAIMDQESKLSPFYAR